MPQAAATFHEYKAKFGGMDFSEVRRLKGENARLKKPDTCKNPRAFAVVMIH